MEPLRYLSLFSGMEAATAALHRLGVPHQPVAFAEIDPTASALLAHKFPHVPNLGDVETIDWSAYRGQADIVFGGSPCQSFSIAGRRLGLDDPRGNLALEYLRAVNEIRPRWFVYENVPGMLGSGDGADFGAFLDVVDEIGYACAWRVLDARDFGLPQRRERLFVVGCPVEQAGDDGRALGAVLAGPPQAVGHPAVRPGASEPARRIGAVDAGDAGRGRDRGVPDPAGVGSARHLPVIGRCGGFKCGNTPSAGTVGWTEGVVPTLTASSSGTNGAPTLAYELDGRWIIRYATPLECLRFQGFEDDWLDGVTVRGKPLSDAARYRLIGNSWAVPVAAWIVDRIIDVDARVTALAAEAA